MTDFSFSAKRVLRTSVRCTASSSLLGRGGTKDSLIRVSHIQISTVSFGFIDCRCEDKLALILSYLLESSFGTSVIVTLAVMGLEVIATLPYYILNLTPATKNRKTLKGY